MKTRDLFFLSLIAIVAVPARGLAARNSPEVSPPQRRQTTVTTAEQLAQRRPVSALPADLISPFAPPDFDKPDPAELQATLLAAQRKAAADAAAGKGAPAVAKKPVAAAGDREMLEKIAAQVVPSGAFALRGVQRLIIGGKSFEVGTRFTATYSKQDYELELVAIDRTTFTLRYRGEEITRPIKPVR